MRPDPIVPRLRQPLTPYEQMMLRMSVVRLSGAREFRAARKLAKAGLGEVADRTFKVSAAGEAMACAE